MTINSCQHVFPLSALCCIDKHSHASDSNLQPRPCDAGRIARRLKPMGAGVCHQHVSSGVGEWGTPLAAITERYPWVMGKKSLCFSVCRPPRRLSHVLSLWSPWHLDLDVGEFLPTRFCCAECFFFLSSPECPTHALYSQQIEGGEQWAMALCVRMLHCPGFSHTRCSMLSHPFKVQGGLSNQQMEYFKTALIPYSM